MRLKVGMVYAIGKGQGKKENFRKGNHTGKDCEEAVQQAHKSVCDLNRLTFTKDHTGYSELNGWVSRS